MKRVSVWIFLCISFLSILGIIRINSRIQEIEENLDFNIPVEIIGEINDIYLKNDNYQLICNTNKIIQNKKVFNISLKVIIYMSDINKIQIGDRIRLNGNINSFSKPTNPGAMNIRSYYFARKIYFSIYGKKANILEHSNYNFKRTIKTIHNKIEKQVLRIYPDEQAGIINILLIGSKNNLDEEIKDLYKIAGISHLLAISGLHISIIGMGIFKLLNRITYNQRLSSIISIIILSFYCFLSGGSISSIRAVFMFIFLQLSYFLNENYDSISALFISGSIILFVNPYQIIDVGFLLSFTAVLGIGILTAKLNKTYNKSNFNPIKNLLFTSIGASIFTYPILLWFFYEIPLYSLIINLLVIPPMSIIMVFSIFSIIFSFIYLPFGMFLGGIEFFILKYIELCCEATSYLPFNTITLGKPNIIIIIIYYLLIYILINGRKIKKFIKINLVLGFLFIVIMINNVSFNYLSISLLDVGQGDAAVIEYENKTILIDGGGQINKKSTKNTGTYVIMPYLASKGISKIDGIFISHSDYDHIYGIIEVIQRIKTGFIALPKPYEENPDDLVIELLKLAEEKNIKIYYFQEGSNYNYKSLNIECIYPFKEYAIYKNNNAKSLVLNIRYNEFSMLFTGDIEKEQENALTHRYNDNIDIIKVPHHGSNTSSTEGFLKAFNPGFAVFSYGKKNSFGHPASIVLDRYKERNIDSYHIANEGAVNIKTKGDSIYISTYLSKRKDKYLCKN